MYWFRQQQVVCITMGHSATLASQLDTFSLNILNKWSRSNICYHSAADKSCQMLSEQGIRGMYPCSFLLGCAYLVLCVVRFLSGFFILTAVTCSASPVPPHHHHHPPWIKAVLSLHFSACVCSVMRHSDVSVSYFSLFFYLSGIALPRDFSAVIF